jgi:hypothetical protein
MTPTEKARELIDWANNPETPDDEWSPIAAPVMREAGRLAVEVELEKLREAVQLADFMTITSPLTGKLRVLDQNAVLALRYPESTEAPK